MRILVLTLLISSCMATPTTNPMTTVFDFTTDTPANAWNVEDDVVMGGRSSSQFTITEEGHGRFTGHVSLENNGGFASIRHQLETPQTLPEDASSFQLRIKGDGKDYTLRVKAKASQNYYHQATFPTSKVEEWETIAIAFASMSAMRYGKVVDVPNYAGEQVTQIQLLIGNGKEQDFAVELDVIEVL